MSFYVYTSHNDYYRSKDKSVELVASSKTGTMHGMQKLMQKKITGMMTSLTEGGLKAVRTIYWLRNQINKQEKNHE